MNLPGKKGIIIYLIFIFIFFSAYQPLNAQIIPLSKLSEVEIVLFSESSNAAIVSRVEIVEKTLYNKIMSGTLIDRVERIIDYVLPSANKPSLVFLLNTLEWSLTNKINSGGIEKRIDELEMILFGKKKSGSLVERMDQLLKLSLPGGKVPAERVNLLSDTLLRIRLLSKISSTTSKIGQKVNFELVEDIKFDGKLLIPAGTIALMEIVDVNEAGNLGQDGEISLRFSGLRAIDGTEVPLKLGEKAQDENRSRDLAIGASILGTIILGPLGLIAGYFVKGEEKELPAGSELYIQTSSDIELYGLILDY
jgi:hypothetical protein